MPLQCITVQISAGGARAMEVLLQLVLLMAVSASLNADPFNDNGEPNSLQSTVLFMCWRKRRSYHRRSVQFSSSLNPMIYSKMSQSIIEMRP